MTFEQIKEKLQHYTVGIAGCGGLGSNCAVSLARVGIGKLILADFDVIEESNLNRQYFFRDQLGKEKAFALKENIEKITTRTVVEAHNLKLNEENLPELFGECHIVVEAFDLAGMKKMIAETVLEKMPDKPLVMGVGLAGYGNSNAFEVKKMGNLYICGDGETETSEDLPPLGPRVGIVSNMQANQVMEILLNGL